MTDSPRPGLGSGVSDVSDVSDLSEPPDEWRAEYEFEPVADEVPRLPWDAILREWMQRRLPSVGRSRWAILSAVLLGNFAAGIVFTLLSVARQSIGDDLGTSASLVTWAFTGPSLAGAVFGPALGRLGDLRGHKRLYLMALGIGVVTSLLVAASWNVGSLIFFRTVAAISGAALGPSSLALIFRSFGREDRVKAMGYWSLVGAGSPVVGVFIGGPIVDHFGWRWMFIGQIPLFLIALVVAAMVLVETPRRAVTSFDWKGASVLALGTLTLLLSINRGPVWGWSDVRVVGGFVVTPVLAALFVWIERRAPSALLPMRLFRHRNVVASISAQMLSQFAYLGAGLFLLNDLLVDKDRFHLTLSEASRLSIARPLLFALIAPAAGLLAIKVGERITATLGMGIVSLAMVLFAVVRPGSSLFALVAATALAGLGMGVASPSLTSSVANSVPESFLGAIGASQQVMAQMGSVAGTVVLATIAGADGARTDSSYRTAFVVAMVVSFGGVLCAWQIRPLRRT